MRYDFEIESDHFQILLGDRVRGPRIDTTHLWDANRSVATLPHAPELVGLGTARFGGKTRIQLEVTTSTPEPEIGWLAMGEFALDVPSGKLLLWAPETLDLERMPTISVAPGGYQGSAFSRRTDAVSDEMATEGQDEYRIVLRRNPESVSKTQGH